MGLYQDKSPHAALEEFAVLEAGICSLAHDELRATVEECTFSSHLLRTVPRDFPVTHTTFTLARSTVLLP